MLTPQDESHGWRKRVVSWRAISGTCAFVAQIKRRNQTTALRSHDRIFEIGTIERYPTFRVSNVTNEMPKITGLQNSGEIFEKLR